jgi:REP element-mobilizing transposase RayT
LANGEGGETPPLRAPKSLLAQVVAYYKYQSTKQINLLKQAPGTPFWQRNYYENIVRNSHAFGQIVEYIHTNPQRWSDDALHPQAQPNRFNQG